MRRDTLIPPPVEDAQAPITVSIISTALENIGHCAKSAVEYPVVVITVTT